MSDALKDKGNAALKDGNFKAAIDAYTDGLKVDPKNHVLYSNRSAAQAKAGNYAEALLDADECIKIKPDWARGYSRRASALLFQSKYFDAEAAYMKALQLDPSNEQVKESLEELKQKKVLGSLTAKVAAHPQLRKKLSDPAYVAKLDLIQAQPQMLMSLLNDDEDMKELFSTLFCVEDMETDAPIPSKKQKTPEPDSASSLTAEQKEALSKKELGNAAYKKKDFEAALKLYGEAISVDPQNITYYTNKSAVYFEMGKFDECIEVCHKAVDVGRENRAEYKLIAKAYARIGNCHEKMGDLVNAKKFYDKSLSEFRAPDVIKKAQSIDKDLKEKEKSAYINPEIAEGEKKKGNDAFTKGDYPKALSCYGEAIRRNPSDAKVYSNRAACYTKLMEFPMALKDCETCIELAPDFVKGYLRKGSCLIAMKDLGGAKKSFRKALEVDPNCQEAKDGLGQCFTNDSDPEIVRQRAMNDPEIAGILSDPAMRMILNQMEDPAALREHLNNPEIASKLMKLIDAGLISVR